MATYKLTQTFSDNTTKDVNFTIPDVVGTYNLKFMLSDSTVIDAGNIERTNMGGSYTLSVKMNDNTACTTTIVLDKIAVTNQTKVTIPALITGIKSVVYSYKDIYLQNKTISATSNAQTITVATGQTIT